MVNKIASVLLVTAVAVSASNLHHKKRSLTCKANTITAIGEVVSGIVTGVTAELFESETLQITNDVIANLTRLNATDATLFDFDNNDTATLTRRSQFGNCKTYAGDALWPTDKVWGVLNKLTGGALIKTVPIASVCYDDFGNKDQAKCDYLAANWGNNSYIFTADPTAINTPLYEGTHCMPQSLWHLGNGHCTVGGLPAYAVNVSSVAHVQLAVNFARNLNLRLVIKNTGHDFAAKSMGGGALSIWTHNLKDIKFYDTYTQGNYSGPALKVGSGVQAFELYAAANKYGVTAVGGEGQTVGVMGGFIQGGGHSPLSGYYGMATDHILAVQLVTADGRFVTATAEQNPDLFWAVRGGGGSTYGVVTSIVVKAQPKLEVSTMTLSIGPTSPTGLTNDKFFQAVRIFFSNFNKWAYEQRQYIYFTVVPVGPDSYMLNIAPWFAPKTSLEDFKANSTEPLLAAWNAIGVNATPTYSHNDNFYDAWRSVFPLEPWGQPALRQGSRLLPRDNFINETKFNETYGAVQSVVEDGAMVIGFNIAPRHEDNTYPDNAVNPAWRNTLCHCILAGLWDETATAAQIQNISQTLTFDWMERLRKVSPGAGSYMSEADYAEPNFTQSFWGDKYPKALELKKRYDPYNVFYAHMAVGSENWEMTEKIYGNLDHQASKLCRVSA